MTIKELSKRWPKRFRNFLVSMKRSDRTSKCSEYHIKKKRWKLFESAKSIYILKWLWQFYPSEHWCTSWWWTLNMRGILGPHRSTSSKPTWKSREILKSNFKAGNYFISQSLLASKESSYNIKLYKTEEEKDWFMKKFAVIGIIKV